MNTSINIIIFVGLIITLISCGQTENREAQSNREYPPGLNAQQKEIFDEMMRVHDEAMPKQGVIYELRNRVVKKLDSLQDMDNPSQDKIKRFQKLNTNLKNAEEAMMQWMRQNDFKYDSLSSEQISQNLNREFAEIKEIRRKMFTAIDSAEKIFKMEPK